MIIIDDIHFIHTLRHPKASDTSTSIDMATILMDYQAGIQAINRPQNIKEIHRHVEISLGNNQKAICRGGIDYKQLISFMHENMGKYFHQSFLQSLPANYKEFDLSNAKKSCENLRYVLQNCILVLEESLFMKFYCTVGFTQMKGIMTMTCSKVHG